MSKDDDSADVPAVPALLPSLTTKLSTLFGFQIPSLPPLPQTLRNIDKALGNLIYAGADNIVKRLEASTAQIEAKSAANVDIIRKTSPMMLDRLGSDRTIEDRALNYTFGHTILKQQNREDVAKKALSLLQVDAMSSNASQADASAEIETDWLNTFSDFVSSKSDEQIQSLWARILAGKIREPSSFSLQSLYKLSALDTKDANLIHEILGLSIARTLIYKSNFSDIRRFIEAEDLGVLSGTSGFLDRTFSCTVAVVGGLERKFPVFVDMLSYHLIMQFTTTTHFKVPSFNLTKFGTELLAISTGFTRDDAYDHLFVEHVKAQGVRVSKNEIVNGVVVATLL